MAEQDTEGHAPRWGGAAEGTDKLPTEGDTEGHSTPQPGGATWPQASQADTEGHAVRVRASEDADKPDDRDTQGHLGMDRSEDTDRLPTDRLETEPRPDAEGHRWRMSVADGTEQPPSDAPTEDVDTEGNKWRMN